MFLLLDPVGSLLAFNEVLIVLVSCFKLALLLLDEISEIVPGSVEGVLANDDLLGIRVVGANEILGQLVHRTDLLSVLGHLISKHSKR